MDEVTTEIREKIIGQYTTTPEGWEKIGWAMVMPLMTRFDFMAAGPKFLGGEHPPQSPVQTAEREFTFPPSPDSITRMQAEVGQWMIEQMDHPILKTIIHNNPGIPIEREALVHKLNPDKHGLVLHGDPAGRLDRTGWPGFNCWLSRAVPANMVIVRECSKNPSGGWHRENIAFELAEFLPTPGDLEHLTAKFRFKLYWQADALPPTTVYHLVF